MRSAPLRFLVIDGNSEGRDLLGRTLSRKFPGCLVVDSDDGDAAGRALAESPIAAVLVQRSLDADGVTLVRRLRDRHPYVPILALSGIDRAAESLAAGASAFLLYDQWLMAGRIVEGLLTPESSPTPVSP